MGVRFRALWCLRLRGGRAPAATASCVRDTEWVVGVSRRDLHNTGLLFTSFIPTAVFITTSNTMQAVDFGTADKHQALLRGLHTHDGYFDAHACCCIYPRIVAAAPLSATLAFSAFHVALHLIHRTLQQYKCSGCR